VLEPGRRLVWTMPGVRCDVHVPIVAPRVALVLPQPYEDVLRRCTYFALALAPRIRVAFGVCDVTRRGICAPAELGALRSSDLLDERDPFGDSLQDRLI
jgi:hypothetical protein